MTKRPAGPLPRRTLALRRTLRYVLAPLPRRKRSADVATYRRLHEVPEPVLAAVGAAYDRLFSEPPWSRRLPAGYGRRKLARELGGHAVWLTVLGRDGGCEGFCWGAAIEWSEVPARTLAGSNLPASARPRLEAWARELGSERVVFVDEIALVHGRRGGRGSLENVIELAVPMLELARAERAPIACWTITRSPVVRVLTGCFAFEIADELGGISLLRLTAPVAADLAVIASRLPVERVRGLVGYALRTQLR